MTRTTSHLLAFLLLTGLSACDKKPDDAGSKAEAKDSDKAKKAEDKPAAKAAKADKAAEAKPADAEPNCDDPSNADAASCKEKDSNSVPSWLSVDLIPHKKVIRKSDAWAGIGTRTWALQLELDKDKFNVDSCIDHLNKALKPHVPRLGEPASGPDGRKTVKGETPDHFISFICGDTEKFGLTVFIGVNAK